MSSKRLKKRVARLARQAKSPPIHSRGSPTEIQKLWHQFKIRTERFKVWISGKQLQHFGPTCRVLELFARRDKIFLALAERRLRWHLPAPKHHHNVLDAAANVVKVEDSISYRFKNRMLCIEALKMSGSESPLYFEGTIHPVLNNNRLALLGDRALSMVVCDLWYRTGGLTRDYSIMEQDVVTRANLALRGRKIGVHEAILGHAGLSNAKPNMIAETFEAILGAVYLDSGSTLTNVSKVVKHVGLDKHPFLISPDSQSKQKEDVQAGMNGNNQQYRNRASAPEPERKRSDEPNIKRLATGSG
ncbi:ribonuclease III domain-containing protein [Lophiotrema nucula]|uniref:Ribonuclease III domain-containing protein n=1 Tax=Lophiotrema nucula TaxID=690887 RepID=A0A6A5YU56_9PLEO|nr:ribonuclease III domain-containing protein [Lophiotrema nucula]